MYSQQENIVNVHLKLAFDAWKSHKFQYNTNSLRSDTNGSLLMIIFNKFQVQGNVHISSSMGYPVNRFINHATWSLPRFEERPTTHQDREIMKVPGILSGLQSLQPILEALRLQLLQWIPSRSCVAIVLQSILDELDRRLAVRCTVGWECMKATRSISRQYASFSMGSGASERANECAQRSVQSRSKQSGAQQMSERRRKWPSTLRVDFIVILPSVRSRLPRPSEDPNHDKWQQQSEDPHWVTTQRVVEFHIVTGQAVMDLESRMAFVLFFFVSRVDEWVSKCSNWQSILHNLVALIVCGVWANNSSMQLQ